MVTLKTRRITYEDREFDPGEIMTIKEASVRLGCSIDAAVALVSRGQLTELIDLEALHQFKKRRFVLRSEVEELAARRERVAEKWGEK